MALTEPVVGDGPRTGPLALAYRALGLGDLLAAVPALRGVAAALPNHQVILATTPGVAPLAGLLDAVAETWAVGELAPFPRPVPTLDVAVNLHGSGPQSTALLRSLHPRRLVAFADPAAGVDGPRWQRPGGAPEHEVRRWCRLVDESLGGRCDPTALDLAVPDVTNPAPGAAVVHVGAAYPSRRWPPERFALVASALAARGLRVVVTGSPAERPIADEVARRGGLPADAVLAGRTDVLTLARLVAGAAVVVCGDTGVAHLATAYRRPSVVLFGPVPPHLWGPPSRPQHIVLYAGDGTGDPFGTSVDPALLRISPDDVVTALDRLPIDSAPGVEDGHGTPLLVQQCGGRGPSVQEPP